MNTLSCDYRILSYWSLADKMTKKENEDNAFHINMSLYPLQNMPNYDAVSTI